MRFRKFIIITVTIPINLLRANLAGSNAMIIASGLTQLTTKQ